MKTNPDKNVSGDISFHMNEKWASLQLLLRISVEAAKLL